MPIRPFDLGSRERALGLRRKLGLDCRTRVLLSVGRLSQEKGHANLVRALPKMMERIGATPFRFVLVGDGPERARIERLSRSLGMASSITLTGQQDDISPYYAIADVFALPSYTEGSPNVLLEAMAAGVPVVATAIGGVPELTRNGRDALLVKSGDMAGLVSATVRLFYDQSLRDRLTRSAREVVLRETPEAFFTSIVSVFQRALR
jgi:glycosyltransferase involved in cell wall biosynthesis